MSDLLDSLLPVLLIPLDPGRRLFWVFIVTALVLACITVSVQQRGFKPRAQLAALLNPRYWFNRSTSTDYGLLALNTGLRGLLLVPLLGSHLAATIAVGSWLQTTFGDAPTLSFSPIAIAIAYTLSFFILEDLSRFGLHFAMHRNPLLWRIHRTHHSATTLTPITVHRVHPLEMSLYYLRGLIVFSLVSGSFLYLFRGQLSGLDILGVDLLGFLFNAFGANLRHSPIFLSFGPLERLFISPAQHQLHHSSATEHRDINFGTCLALWDHLAGSWRQGRTGMPLTFGLAEGEVNTTPVTPLTGAMTQVQTSGYP